MAGRWTLVALIASLALNLFLLGTGATALLLGARWLRADPVQRSIPHRAAAAFTPDHRAAFLAMLRDEGTSVRGDNRQARRLRVDAWGSLGDTNLDPAAARAKLTQANALNQASRAKVEAAIIDFAVALPRPERAAFGQAMRRAILANGPVAPERGAPPPTGRRY